MTSPQKLQCYHQELDDSQWTASMTSNIILGLGFCSSCLIDEPWIWARLLFILGYSIASNVAFANCQFSTFIWTILLIIANIYKLLKLAYDHRPSKVPQLLQDLHQNVFRAYNLDKPTFAKLVGHSQITGIGAEDILLQEGILRHDHGDLLILISGRMSVWCEDLLLHAIQPGQFINSVEWTAMQTLDCGHDFGWEQQVCITADEDSTYLRVSHTTPFATPRFEVRPYVFISVHRRRV